jgi:hypothetical protein
MKFRVTYVHVGTAKLINSLIAFPITFNRFIDVQITSCWPKPFATSPEEILAGSQ